MSVSSASDTAQLAQKAGIMHCMVQNAAIIPFDCLALSPPSVFRTGCNNLPLAPETTEEILEENTPSPLPTLRTSRGASSLPPLAPPLSHDFACLCPDRTSPSCWKAPHFLTPHPFSCSLAVPPCGHFLRVCRRLLQPPPIPQPWHETGLPMRPLPSATATKRSV